MYSPAINSFSIALIELAKEKGLVALIQPEVASIIEGLKIPQVNQVLTHPKTPLALKKSLLKRLVSPKTPQELLNFLDLIIDRHREELLLPIMERVFDLTVTTQGYEIVELISAQSLTETKRAEVENKLEKLWKTRLYPKYRENPNLLGGLIVRRGDVFYDGSLTGQIKALREALLEQSKLLI